MCAVSSKAPPRNHASPEGADRIGPFDCLSADRFLAQFVGNDVLCDGLSVPERDQFGAGLELGPKEELSATPAEDPRNSRVAEETEAQLRLWLGRPRSIFRLISGNRREISSAILSRINILPPVLNVHMLAFKPGAESLHLA